MLGHLAGSMIGSAVRGAAFGAGASAGARFTAQHTGPAVTTPVWQGSVGDTSLVLMSTRYHGQQSYALHVIADGADPPGGRVVDLPRGAGGGPELDRLPAERRHRGGVAPAEPAARTGHRTCAMTTARPCRYGSASRSTWTPTPGHSTTACARERGQGLIQAPAPTPTTIPQQMPSPAIAGGIQP